MESRLPPYITQKLKVDKHYYDLNNGNILRCKEDSEYLGDVMLVNENLIWHSVHKYIGKPENLAKYNCVEKDDILQLGRIGFIKAINAFDVSRGFKFSSFAVITIVREVRCFLRDTGGIIRPTRTAKDLLNRIYRIENELGYLPSTEELSELLDEDIDKITKVLQVGRPVKYLDEPISFVSPTSSNSLLKDSGITLKDTIDDFLEVEDMLVNEIHARNILDYLEHRLSTREYEILKTRLLGYSQTETAKELNISPMKVSRALKKIADILSNDAEYKGLFK